jgi:hypothetical protein
LTRSATWRFSDRVHHYTTQSAPQIATDSAGNYVVYVVTVDAFTGTGFNTPAQRRDLTFMRFRRQVR